MTECGGAECTDDWCTQHLPVYGLPRTTQTRTSYPYMTGQYYYCRIENCDGLILARGWCKFHYTRWYTKGDPLWKPPQPISVEERFWSKVSKGPGPDDCWLWTKGCDDDGYGRFWIAERGNNVQAHRFSYQLAFGPVGLELVVDHTCRARSCVRPDHLEAVSNAENLARGKRYRWFQFNPTL